MAFASRSALAADPADWNGLFTRVGSELRTLADVVNNLQRFLTPIVSDVVARDLSALTRLQDLDALEQSLHNLSEFMSCLDASTALIDVAAVTSGVKTIRLAALARRLSSGSTEAAMPDTSDVELF